MTKLRLLALLAVVALVLFPAIAFTQGGAPQLPCAFHGTVQVNGQDVPDGTVITAMIGNATPSTTTTNSTYMIVIAEPTGVNYDGMTVSFKIGNATASQTGTWKLGDYVALNLSKGVPIPPTGGGVIQTVQIQPLPAGSQPTVVSWDPTTGALVLGMGPGAAGSPGQNGQPGSQGPAGKSASNVYGIIGIALAVIAIIIALVVMMRKPQPAPPAQKT
jgi:hypothetical protein